ncbi:NADPH-dependent FMN reductase [Streptomyces sp. NPDC004838]
METTVLVGNPKPRSRTLEAAVNLATLISGAPPTAVIDVIELGPDLLEWGKPSVQAAVETVSTASLLVVASPTFKATYTGVLKLFLDQIPSNGLDGVVAVPLMLGAGPAHAMAPDLLLKPVLVELGATCPTAGIYLPDRDFTNPDLIAPWLVRATRQLGLTGKQEA